MSVTSLLFKTTLLTNPHPFCKTPHKSQYFPCFLDRTKTNKKRVLALHLICLMSNNTVIICQERCVRVVFVLFIICRSAN